jgi:hypothetical protein
MSYISNKMALSGTTLCDEIKASGQYKWGADGKCYGPDGKPYPGDQKNSNCTCLGPAPAQSGWGALIDYGLNQAKSFLQPAQQSYSGPQGRPSGALTGSGLLVPAVAVVGGVALLLILKKKK